jgi:glycosyltransferase involved in cell wall biosynthesis
MQPVLANMEQPPTTKDSSPKRLALVITELEPGGAERCLVELATRLDRSRYSPVVYSLAPLPVESKQALVGRLAEEQIPVHYLGLTRPWEYFAAVRRLASLFHQQQAQIVQTFLFHANIVGTRAAHVAGVPHVLTGIRVADPRWWRTSLERAATLSADRFVCVSQSVAQFCRQRGFASEKLAVIPNGVDLVRWRDARPASLQALGISPKRRLLLYVGRLDKQKGLDRFFQELPVVFRDLPDHDLILAGEGSLMAALSCSALALGIQNRVHLVGWQTNIPSLMAAAELLVLPSRWEGMPNVVLEAMAAGKPVIATQSEGTVELLGLGAIDQTVPVGDWPNFRNRLIEIAKDRALANDLGHRNQRRAQQFSLEFVADRYQRLYDSICRRSA